MQTLKIKIEDCGEFARCSIPIYGDMYGRSVQEIYETLDLMNEHGCFAGIFELEGEYEQTNNYNY